MEEQSGAGINQPFLVSVFQFVTPVSVPLGGSMSWSPLTETSGEQSQHYTEAWRETTLAPGPLRDWLRSLEELDLRWREFFLYLRGLTHVDKHSLRCLHRFAESISFLQSASRNSLCLIPNILKQISLCAQRVWKELEQICLIVQKQCWSEYFKLFFLSFFFKLNLLSLVCFTVSRLNMCYRWDVQLKSERKNSGLSNHNVEEFIWTLTECWEQNVR